MAHATLPSGLAVEFRGMTGREEDLMTDRKKWMNGTVFGELMTSCVTSLGEKSPVTIKDIDDLASHDRTALLLAIRIETFGEILSAELDCDDQGCREKWAVDVDLSMIPTVAPSEEEQPFKRTLSDGTEVSFGYMTGTKEMKLVKVTTGLLTEAMLLRLVEVSNVHPNGYRKWLQDLPSKLRSELRKHMESVECGPKAELTADCPACGRETAFHAARVPGFFFLKDA